MSVCSPYRVKLQDAEAGCLTVANMHCADNRLLPGSSAYLDIQPCAASLKADFTAIMACEPQGSPSRATFLLGSLEAHI